MNTLMRGLIFALGAIVAGVATGKIEDWLADRRRDTRRVSLTGFIIQSILGVVAFFYVLQAYLGH